VWPNLLELWPFQAWGDRFTLVVLGEDEAGNLCATSTLVSVSARDFCQLVSFGQAVNPDHHQRSRPNRRTTETRNSPGNSA
jgi:hypothetical protein